MDSNRLIHFVNPVPSGDGGDAVKWVDVSLEETGFSRNGDWPEPWGVFCLCLQSHHLSAVLANRACVLAE